MKELLDKIDEISRYGLIENVDEKNKPKNLERHLVKIYDMYFENENEYEFDETNYPKFNKKDFLNTRENIASNFPNFGYYKVATLPFENDYLMADAIEDIHDIIYDLLEVKWRFQNTSESDAKWFFNFIFESHTKNHIINLLNYISATDK